MQLDERPFMKTAAPEIVEDEVVFLESLVALRSAAVLELGCGKAEFARRLVERTPVAFVTALEVDRAQHLLNVAGAQHPKLAFGFGAAEDIPFAESLFDGVVMMKSLHHVPVEAMDRALKEVRRVLKPAGWLYVSEPVYAGELNDIVRLFHDEARVRSAAYQALQRSARVGVFEWVAERAFEMRAFYSDYNDFVDKHVRLTHSEIHYSDAIAAEVRKRLAPLMTPRGATFARPMRANLLRRTKSSR